jgi:hypothetical protein
MLVFAMCIGSAAAALAQTGSSSRPQAADAVFARARQLVLNGNGAAGRVLVDSVIATTNPDAPTYAEALFWRASLAAESQDAERDYRRIIVEYPLSSRTNESLLKLGELEAARGDRPPAAAHLDRYLEQNLKFADRGRLGLQVVRLFFELNNAPRGCATLARVLTSVPGTDVEMRNQLSYFAPRCAGVDTTHVNGTPVAQPVDSAPPARHTRRDSTSTRRAAAGFTLQVAAYGSRKDADQLATKLKARGLDAAVAGTSRPFRVHVGRYPTRAAATAAAKQLKTRKIDGFVTAVVAGQP